MSESMNVVVVNSTPRLVALGAGNVQLAPGENDVDRDVLQENLDHPNGIVAGWFDEDSGFLSVKKNAKKARALAADLSQINAARAIQTIEKTDNVDVLKKWMNKEQRSTVNKAFTKRLAELRTANDNPEKSAAGGQEASE